jgi:hypothetical protein
MKFSNSIFVIFLLAISLTACKRDGSGAVSQGAGNVLFPDAGVSIDVGDGWKRIDISPGPPVCPPTLVGSAGVVRAMLFAPHVTDMQAATKAVRAMFDHNPDAVKDSYHQEPFTTDSGLHGQHAFYSDRTEKDGNITELRSHNFIVQRADGRCVSISYLATAQSESDALEQMIEKSLRLQGVKVVNSTN